MESHVVSPICFFFVCFFKSVESATKFYIVPSILPHFLLLPTLVRKERGEDVTGNIYKEQLLF